MVFSGVEFLFLFLPLTLLAYFSVPRKYIKARNAVLLAVSLLFYGWGEPVYLFLMVITVILSYFYGYKVGKSREKENGAAAKGWLLAAVITNLGILGFFKYVDFFIGIFNHIPGVSIPLLGVELPIGISFYTFQILSYVVDVYRGDAVYQKNPATLGTYVALFPQLIAGPIVRYRDVDDQLTGREESIFLFSSGVRTFVCGLCKKVLLANSAAEAFKYIRELPDGQKTVVGAWLGILLFAFQIYFDFSGYSDMAIGLGKMFGFRFLENFNYPYISKSVTDFWRRWHISLSSWFKEYVYIPLGGNRTGKKYRNFLNLFAVWFLTGFWHGAGWNFILWGLFFFGFLMLEKTFLLKAFQKMPRFIPHLYTGLVVLFGWILFYFEDMGEGIRWIGNMFGAGTAYFADRNILFLLARIFVLMIILCVGCTPLPKKLFYRLAQKNAGTRVMMSVLGIAGCILSVASIVASDSNPFLYFNF